MGLNKPVDYTTAKLLKEKGFDENCYRTYSNGEISPFPLLENMGGEPILNPLDYKWKNSLIHPSVVTAPTIAEVVMWLYDKHGIWIACETSRLGKFNYRLSKKESSKLKTLPFTFEVVNAGYDYNSPTEAYTQAITYTLKNLI